MPLYEYECCSCQSQFELLIRGDEAPVCPECGATRVERLLSVTARPAQAGAADSFPVCNGPPAGGGSCGLPQCQRGL